MTDSRVVGELSARGLASINPRDYDFAFVLRGDEILCSRFQAQFLSPTVCSVLRNDASLNRIEIEVETEHKSVITSFLSQLIETGRIDIPVSDLCILSEFARFLGNSELLDLFGKQCSEKVDESNVLQRLKLFPTEDNLSFLAAHFSSVCTQPAIESLSLDVLSSVLSHIELRLENEDSLFRFIESLCSRNESYRDLIEHVESQYLSESCIGDYISFLDSDPDGLSRGTWYSICRRLCLQVSPLKANPRVNFTTVAFDRDKSSMFRGIFHKMREECKQNPHLSGQVKVSATDEYSSCTLQVHDLIVASGKTGKYWGTNDTAVDHYVKFEFPTCRICPSGYSLKAHNASWGNNSGSHFIRSWRFEGSNDDSSWTTLDTQTNSNAIAGNDKEAFFGISTTQAYRFLRIVTSSLNSASTYHFSLQQIEIFGGVHPGARV
jgi:hypothetical protein